MRIKQSLNMKQVFRTPEENELKNKIKISGSHSGNIFPVQSESGIIYLQEKARLLNESLLEFLPITHPDGLNCAMRHLLDAGGKRLRPAAMLLAAKAVGGREENVLPAAVAIELI